MNLKVYFTNTILILFLLYKYKIIDYFTKQLRTKCPNFLIYLQIFIKM